MQRRTGGGGNTPPAPAAKRTKQNQTLKLPRSRPDARRRRFGKRRIIDGGNQLRVGDLSGTLTTAQLIQAAFEQGADVEAAVYSEHFEHLSLIRKILIRMKSWESYLYLDH